MKQNILYIILGICLVIIFILLTILSKPHKYNTHLENNHPLNKNKMAINKPNNYSGYPMHNNIDIDNAYDYDGYSHEPSRWWNNLWDDKKSNIYNRRDNYDRRDGLDMNNRYINNNNIHINTQPKQQNTQSQLQLQPIENVKSKQHISQPVISLVKPLSNNDSPLPILTSSSPIMPEEVSMPPMSQMCSSENVIQTISTFTSDIPSSYQTGYVSNFNYKGSDSKNQKPFPIDMMASESIYLQPNTVANQIIIPPVVMENLNSNCK